MRVAKSLSLFFFLGLLMTACLQPPDYPAEPVIEFSYFSSTGMNQRPVNGKVDTLFVVFDFTDGDGDIGLEGDDATLNIDMFDLRDGSRILARLPKVEALGAQNGISGEISIRITNDPNIGDVCCVILPDNGGPGQACVPDIPPQQVGYSIRIQDQAGNWSNTIETPTFTLNCN